MKNIYLDNAATTRLDDEVLDVIVPYLKDEYGNASAIYSIGRSNKEAIEVAREKIAKEINCNPSEIYFTSCGTESDNLAIKGIAYKNKDRGNHIITSKIEHLAVLETCKQLEKEGFEVTYLSVDENGIIDLEELKNSIKKETILISVMFANNEIGTIEPIKEIGRLAKENNIYFHSDCVQAVGNLKIDVKDLNLDSISLSSHKFYGPKGVGALYIRNGVKFSNIMNGGHQEKNKRPGTENVAGIVGMGKAIELAYEDLDLHREKVKKLRDYYEEEIIKKIPYIKINGDREKRLPGNSNISFKDIKADSLLINLDMKGICASSGSACTSGSIEPSHVLVAIGNNREWLNSSLRITIGKYNTKDEIDYLIECLVEIINRLRNLFPE